ncbi:MAG TPA: SIMPL domain-containing protein [Allosphingosinicella sp.]
MRLAGVAAALALTAALSAPAAAQDVAIALAPGEVLLKVEAQGEHLDRPDVMSISAGVVTTGRSAKDALAANAAMANRLVAAVRASGIEPRDVQTTQLAVRPQFDRGGDEGEDSVRRITGYVARNSVALRLRDLGKAPDIVNALFEAGANEVQGPSFSLQDPAPALKAARFAAVAEARSEADTYAEALGMRIARVLRVSERSSFEGEDAGYITVTGSRIPLTPLEPGEVRTRVQLWIDYAMVPR